MAQNRIMIIGGDNSSDLYGASLAQALKEIIPDLALLGVGGALMQDSGVELIYNISELENLGGFEALRASHVVKRLIQRISESMDQFQPGLIVQIGLPVFSLKLIELAKTKEIPVAYYNSPLNWGTEEVKISRLAEAVDLVIGVSRYETELCQNYGIAVEFAGHPLVDIADAKPGRKTAQELNLTPGKPILALIPGLRETEVNVYLPTLFKAVNRINMEGRSIQTVVTVPQSVSQECCNKLIEKWDVDTVTFTDDVHSVLSCADAAVVTSGSASIMAALSQVPAVAIHKVTAATYLFNKMLLRKPPFAMINFLMQDYVIPELVQNDFTEAKVAEAVITLLEDQNSRLEYLEKLQRLPEEFGTSGAVERAARIIAKMLKTG
ncbi:MAG: hypothetical protein GX177_07835 [Firmicutes bacterium]|nr:hypothetical protein [Bacillota bacterium]